MSRIPIHHSNRRHSRLARLLLPALAGAVALAFAAPGTHAQSGPITPAEVFFNRPAISIGDVTVTEPLDNPEEPTSAPNEVPARFTVRLSVATGVPVLVNFRTVDGTARAGSDYVAKSGTLSIPAGATSGTITVMVKKDVLHEADEAFFVKLSAPVNGVLADDTGVGTIIDNTL